MYVDDVIAKGGWVYVIGPPNAQPEGNIWLVKEGEGLYITSIAVVPDARRKGHARKLVAQDTLQPAGRVIEIEEVPLTDVRVTLVKLHLDVINEELKRLRTLPPSDPQRIGLERELILRQFAVRKASLS